MGFEVPKPNISGDSKERVYLSSAHKALAEEQQKIKDQYELSYATLIFKDPKGVWRFFAEPYQSLEEWKQNKDDKEKANILNKEMEIKYKQQSQGPFRKN